jgi:hypothetical protein
MFGGIQSRLARGLMNDLVAKMLVAELVEQNSEEKHQFGIEATSNNSLKGTVCICTLVTTSLALSPVHVRPARTSAGPRTV